MEFFDRFRNDCQKCRNFVAEICACIPFGDTRKVFIADGPGCKRLLPLESSRNGFLLQADQIQPFSNGHCKLIMTTCYDCKNDHVTISNYYRAHAKCDCRSGRCGCECEKFEGMEREGFEGREDGVDGMMTY